MMNEFMLSTIDTPYSPFIDYDLWFAWDSVKGYNTSSFLARIANVSNDLSDLDYNTAIEEAIDEIVKENVLGLYIKVARPTPMPIPPTYF
jgi:hypothetical protein